MQVTRYVIVVHAVATPDNKSFAGEEAFYYNGKEGQTLKATGSHIDNDKFHVFNKEYIPYFLYEYGYKRKCDAKRIAAQRQKFYDECHYWNKYWKETVTYEAVTFDYD